MRATKNTQNGDKGSDITVDCVSVTYCNTKYL